MKPSLSLKHLLLSLGLSLINTNSWAALNDCKQPLNIAIKGPVVMRFCQIPANPSMPIGSGRTYESPVKKRAFDAFYIGQFEVTQLQYKAIMLDVPWKNKAGVLKKDVDDQPSSPAVYISYHDAKRFLDKLNLLEKKFVYRLPTEAEWEYAARGEKTIRYWEDKVNPSYVYAIQPSDYNWRGQNVATCPSQTGKKDYSGYCANGFGLMHTAGNVAELTEDDYEEDYYGASTNGHIPTKSKLSDKFEKFKVVRGGSVKNMENEIRNSARTATGLNEKSAMIGFRVVRVPKALNDIR